MFYKTLPDVWKNSDINKFKKLIRRIPNKSFTLFRNAGISIAQELSALYVISLHACSSACAVVFRGFAIVITQLISCAEILLFTSVFQSLGLAT